jgi:hypothetical protein
LTKLYRNKERSENFVDSCILIGEMVLTLRDRGIQSKSKKEEFELSYSVATKTDLDNPNNSFHFLDEINIDLLIKREKRKKTTATKNKSAEKQKEKQPDIVFFLLQIIAPTLPRPSIRKRIKNFISFYYENQWEETRDEPFPIIMIVCPTLSTLIYIKRLTRKLLEDEDNPSDLRFQFTTVEQVRKHGITGEIWEVTR